MTTSTTDDILTEQLPESSTPPLLQSAISKPHYSGILPATHTKDDSIIDSTSTVETEQNEKSTNPAYPKTQVRQLFVGNLPFRIRWQDLKDLFRQAGHVLRADVALNFDNRSKGHGTVLFANLHDAQKAIDMLHNSKWHGRVLEVREDRGYVEQPFMKQSSSTSSSSGSKVSSLRQDNQQQQHGLSKSESSRNQVILPGRQLFVGNLPFHCQWQDIKDLFRRAGKIIRADVVQVPDGRSRGFGTVLFASTDDAIRAIDMLNGFEYQGRQLRVHFDKFATGTSHHHQQQQQLRNDHDYLSQQTPSRFENIEFNSKVTDPTVLESLKQTYGSNSNNINNINGIYSTLSSFLPNSTDSTYPPSYIKPRNQNGQQCGDYISYNRQPDTSTMHHPSSMYSNRRSDHDTNQAYFGYYSTTPVAPLHSLSHNQDMINQQSAFSFGTDGIMDSETMPKQTSSLLFGYQSQPFVSSPTYQWAPPSLRDLSPSQKQQHTPQPYLYSPYQQPIYQKSTFYDTQPYRHYHHQQKSHDGSVSDPITDDLNDNMQRMKLSNTLDGAGLAKDNGDYGSTNGFGVDGGENGNSGTTSNVWDPLNRLKL